MLVWGALTHQWLQVFCWWKAICPYVIWSHLDAKSTCLRLAINRSALYQCTNSSFPRNTWSNLSWVSDQEATPVTWGPPTPKCQVQQIVSWGKNSKGWMMIWCLIYHDHHGWMMIWCLIYHDHHGWMMIWCLIYHDHHGWMMIWCLIYHDHHGWMMIWCLIYHDHHGWMMIWCLIYHDHHHLPLACGMEASSPSTECQWGEDPPVEKGSPSSSIIYPLSSEVSYVREGTPKSSNSWMTRTLHWNNHGDLAIQSILGHPHAQPSIIYQKSSQTLLLYYYCYYYYTVIVINNVLITIIIIYHLPSIYDYNQPM